MLRKLVIGALGAIAVLFSNTAFAQGTAAEAKAMLEKAVAAVKADEAVALAMFIKGEGGFKDRDLYVFCFRSSDGKALASPPSVPAGTDVRRSRTPLARPLVRSSTLRHRSQKVKSPRSAICFRGQAPTRRRFKKLVSLRGWAIWAAVSAITLSRAPCVETLSSSNIRILLSKR